METQSSATNGQSQQTPLVSSSTSGTSSLTSEPVSDSTAPRAIIEAHLKAPEALPSGHEAVTDFLGIARTDQDEQDKAQFIWDHYAKGRDRADAMEAIRRAKDRISPPAIGESYLHKLFVYARLEVEARSIEREKKTYEN